MGKNGEPKKKKFKFFLLNDLLNPILEPMYQGSQAVLKQTTQSYPILLFIPVLFNMLKSKQENEIKETSINKNNTFGFMYDVQNPIENFTGREEKLSKIHELLHNQSEIGYNSVAVIDELTQHVANMHINQDSKEDRSKATISGLGGIGKTQLAKMYVKKYAHCYDNNIIWINAEKPLSSFFKKLAGELNVDVKINGQDKEDKDIARSVYNYFKDKKSLFIFDNAENYKVIENFLPQQSSGNKPYVLISSRWQNWENVIDKISLDCFEYEETRSLIIKKGLKDVLSKEELINFSIKSIDEKKLQLLLNKLKEESDKGTESMNFVQQMAEDDAELAKILEFLSKSQEENGYQLYSKLSFDSTTLIQQVKEVLSEIKDRSSNDDQIKRLHGTLQGFPLALQQAIAYIKEERTGDSSFGIEAYLQKYNISYKEAEKLLSYKPEEYNDPYTTAVMATWQITLNKIKNYEDKSIGDAAIRILSIMAYLPPDNISSKIFEKLPNFEEGKHIKATNLLRAYSMISQGSSIDSTNIHRLVQEVRLIELKKAEQSEEIREETVLADMLEIFEPINIFSKTNRTFHIFLTCLCASQYSQLSQQIKKIIPKIEEVIPTLYRRDAYCEESLTQSILELAIESEDNNLIIKSLKSVSNVWEKQKQQILEKILREERDIKSSTIRALIKSGLDIKSKLSDILKLQHDKIENFLKAMKSCKQFNEEEKFLCLEKAIGEPTGEKNQELFNFLIEKNFLDAGFIQEKFTKLLEKSFYADAVRLIDLVGNSEMAEKKEHLIKEMLYEAINSEAKSIFNHLKKKYSGCLNLILKEAIDKRDKGVLDFLGKKYKKFDEYVVKIFDEDINKYLTDRTEDNEKLDKILYMYSTSSTRKAVIKNWLKECKENYCPFPIEYQKFEEDVQYCKFLLKETRKDWKATTELLDTDLEILYNQMFFLRHNQELVSDAVEDDGPSRTREMSISSQPTPIAEDNELSDSGSFEEFTLTESRGACSTPSSAMEVVDVQQSNTQWSGIFKWLK